MAQPASDLTYAHESAQFVERRARSDLSQTLEHLAARLEQTASTLRRLAGEADVPVADRTTWAQHEITALRAHLDAGDDHLAGLALVWADARAELDGLDALLEDERPA
jgi:hypothetical protein